MVKVLKGGADIGNNALKLWIDGTEPYMIPSAYSIHLGETTEQFDMQDIHVEDLAENIDVTINSKSLSRTNVRYIVGEKVVNDRLSANELEKKSNKSTDELPVIILLAGLAVDAMTRNTKKDNIEVKYDLGVALPVLTINKESAIAHENRLMGIHEVIFHHPSGRNVTITINIEFCKCVPEGAAAAWGVVFDEKGKLTTRKIEKEGKVETIDFADRTMLHIDIGAGTTEVVVTKGVMYNPNLSEGLRYGTKETILEVIKRWNREFDSKAIDSIAEFNDIYFDSEHPRHIGLTTYSKQAIYQLAVKLSSVIIDKYDDLKDEPFTFIYGGGSIILKEYLEEILNTKGRSTNVAFLNDPIFVNARGLLVLTNSPIFEKEKERSLGELVAKAKK